ncbi:MEMO1 family protein CCP3SC5AM1_v1_990008 [Gammaproteobacteria bacterium]
MNSLRLPAVAGLFYPADPRELRAMVISLLQKAQVAEKIPKALIAPHAGYVYSGPIAASAYASLTRMRGTVNRVVLMGPSHRVSFSGIALPSAAFFVTPMGKVAVEPAIKETLAGLPQVLTLDQAHAQEHSLEVHLPFLQEGLGTFSLVPMVVGDASSLAVAEVLERLWGGPETLIVVSSDLSHYHDYETARQLDAATSRAIEGLMPDAIYHEHACGRNPVNGLLTVARRLRISPRTIDLRNSGDTAGSRNRVVGYGAYTFAG